jgi:hypothetical protein
VCLIRFRNPIVRPRPDCGLLPHRKKNPFPITSTTLRHEDKWGVGVRVYRSTYFLSRHKLVSGQLRASAALPQRKEFSVRAG